MTLGGKKRRDDLAERIACTFRYPADREYEMGLYGVFLAQRARTVQVITSAAKFA